MTSHSLSTRESKAPICWRTRRSSGRIPRAKGFDAVLDLVGNSTTLDSLRMLRRAGEPASPAGWDLAPIADFNPLLQMACGVYLTFFGSFVFGTPGFPLSDVPLQGIAEDAAVGRLEAMPSHIFASRKSERRIASWRRTRPAGSWSSSAIDRRGPADGHRRILATLAAGLCWTHADPRASRPG